jgi:hypothetical protein
MNKNFLILIITILIVVVFYVVNMFLKRSIEKFGIYCGSYNLDKATAKRYCQSDPECAWNSLKDPNTGLMNEWCSQNPNGVNPTQKLSEPTES